MSKFLFILFTSLIVAVVALDCGDNGEKYPGEDKCVYVKTELEYYFTAYHSCLEMGAIPVKIQNLFENAYTFSMLETKNLPIGAYIGVELQKGNLWTYADGTPLTYTHWAPGHPDLSRNSSICTVMSTRLNGLWISADCSCALPFLCSKGASQNGDIDASARDMEHLEATPAMACNETWSSTTPSPEQKTTTTTTTTTKIPTTTAQTTPDLIGTTN